MTPKQTLDSLDEAGRLLAPILQAEGVARSPSVSLCGTGFQVSAFADSNYGHHVSGHGDTLSAAFTNFLANRSDKLRELEREAQERAEFEAFKAQKREAA